VQKIAAALAVQGCATLDMPITGGYIAAYEGKLVLMVGGDEATLARALPAFYSFAHIIMRAGDVGAGQVAKLAHQLVMGMNVMALLEGLAFGKAGGVEPAVLKQILKDGLANSTVLQVWGDLGPRWKGMLKPAVPGAEVPNLRKDLHTVLELARELGVELRVGKEASRIADAGVATGHDDPLL
jgi:3-hydroxyisobutyrate dehydrogenase-like beta-hydroxyacid dehydrogenase